MLTVYQELIPLSNKMYSSPISKDGNFTNPVIVPFVYNATGTENIMETVIYLRNDSQENYYSSIVVALMKEGAGDAEAMASGTLAFNNGNITFSLNGEDVAAEAAFVFSPAVTGSQTVEDAYRETYLPVVDDGTVSVKLSYGYDELSYDEWAMKSSALVIPAIGTTGMADTSYIPIRMRLTWKVAPSIFTIRDYFIDVSYVSETAI